MKHNELRHYGIKGMKWGVRRTEAQLARARGSSTKSNSSETKANTARKKTSAKETSSKSAKSMTDEELNRAVRRLQLEKQYSDLSPKQVSAGEKFVNTTLNKVVVPAVTEGTKQFLTDYVKRTLTDMTKKTTK